MPNASSIAMLPRPSGFLTEGFYAQLPTSEPKHLDVNITHTYDANSSSSADEFVQTSTRMIAASHVPTTLYVTTRVQGMPRQVAPTPAYSASIRRDHVMTLAKDIRELARNAHRADFAVCTFPIVDRLRDLINKILLSADSEGNTREILRRLRDTFMNRGWESYREPAAREAAASIFDRLAALTDVLPEHVDEVLDRLSEINLAPFGLEILDADAEKEVSD